MRYRIVYTSEFLQDTCSDCALYVRRERIGMSKCNDIIRRKICGDLGDCSDSLLPLRHYVVSLELNTNTKVI